MSSLPAWIPCLSYPTSLLTMWLWTNPCSRVRELEEELGLMDQNLKSMMCEEEEVHPTKSQTSLTCCHCICLLSNPALLLKSMNHL